MIIIVLPNRIRLDMSLRLPFFMIMNNPIIKITVLAE